MLHIRETDDTLTRVIGAGLSTAVPLIIGLLIGNMRVATFGSLGAFAFLSFQPFSTPKLARRISIVGISIMAGLFIGGVSSLQPWTSPIALGFVSLLGFLICRILRIPNPGPFLVIMVTAMGTGLKLPFLHLLQAVSYVGIGVLASLFWACLAGYINHRYLKRPYRDDTKTVREHLYEAVEQDSALLLSSVHHAAIIFFRGLLSAIVGVGQLLLERNFLCGSVAGTRIESHLPSEYPAHHRWGCRLGDRDVVRLAEHEHSQHGRRFDYFELLRGICDGP